MINGVIVNRDLLRHPVALYQLVGFVGFFRIMVKIFSRRTYQLIEFLK